MIAALLAMLAAPQAALAPEAYRAIGEDAPWTLTIAEGRLSFEAPGRPAVSMPAPKPANDDGMLYYQSRRLSVSVMPGVTCEAFDGRRYSDAVYVSIGQDDFSGCGGIALAADALAGTSWLFAEIDGEATELTGDLLRDDRFAIDFHVDGFVGYGGCNRFAAAYSQSGDLVTTHGPWSRGARNCGPRVTDRETRLLQILSEPFRVSRPDAETMVLTGERGAVRLRRTSEDD